MNKTTSESFHESIGAPIILVPGFWLGAWAWDDAATALRADGHHVSALTLPGLESADKDGGCYDVEVVSV